MANEIPFDRLCNVLEDLSQPKKTKPEKDRVLTNFLDEIKLELVESGKTRNLFPILRLILPDLERDRSAYNLKEAKLGQLLVKAMAISKTSTDGHKLLNFRTVKNSSEGSDFPSVAFFVHKNRVRKTAGNYTVGDINDHLDRISEAEVGNKGPILDEVFTKVLKHTTARQVKWFLRIVLKDMKLGLGKHRILAALNHQAPELYDACTSLSKVCSELDESNLRPAELGVELFSAVSPMLSERLDVKNVTRLPEERVYQVEIKFDGERFQMHMQVGRFAYFSRRGFNFTEKFGEHYHSEGFLTPLLEGSFSPNAKSFVLDGEMMGWNKQHQCFGSKGMSFDVKKITENSKHRPCFCVFDILYYNGRSLVGSAEKGGVPLHERLKILDKLFADIHGVIMHSQRRIVKIPEILPELNKSRENGEEGIVVKDCDSYYIANRRNAGWYKIKPEYTEGAMDDLDFVVIGADFAENKRAGLARSFVVACIDKDESDVSQSRYLAVGRVSTGLSFEERERVCTVLAANWKKTAQSLPPSCLVFNKVKPDLWMLPKDSVVFTVRASELIRSTDFGTEYTLRFPRILKLREDKPICDITSVQELNALVANKGPVVKLSNNEITTDIIDLKAPARRKRTAAPLEVADAFVIKTGDVTATSQALKGRKICILSDDEDCNRDELGKIVLSHGGVVVPNISANTWCCVAGRLVARVRNAIEAQQCDVATTTWLRSLQPSSTLTPGPKPLDLMAITDATKLKLSRQYDSFGDSYMEPTDVATLKHVFDKMDENNEPENYLLTSEMLELDAELFPEENPYSFLRPCKIYLKDQNSYLAIKSRMFGANLQADISSKLSHYVVTSESKEEVCKCKIGLKSVFVVSQDWLEACLTERKLVSVSDYLL